MKLINNYELICGIEVHAELAASTKIFCSCPTSFGAEPNTHCCPICTGMPGALPTLNRRAVELAVTAGMALGCEIARFSRLDRKNYFYPDLPKAYQISQLDLPLCIGGSVELSPELGSKRIGITRIHIEEDAGKLIHDAKLGTLIDCNRCGVPLIEIVSEPDLRSAEEAVAYLRELRAILLYTGVSDCRMNEGSLRFDVNLSVRRLGETELGTRTEIKNLNSFAFVQKAIEVEYRRQVELIESGGRVAKQTLRFDPDSGRTTALRTKEDADDYRFFPEPDLPPIIIDEKELDRLRETIPTLPASRRNKYVSLGLSVGDAAKLTEDKAVADYFESAAELTKYPKQVANLILGELFSLLPPGEEISIPISAEHLASVADMAGEGVINSSTAKKLIRSLWKNDRDPEKLVQEQGLAQIRDRELLTGFVEAAISADPKAVAAFRAGKRSAAGAIMGRIMAATGGRGDPELISELLASALDSPR